MNQIIVKYEVYNFNLCLLARYPNSTSANYKSIKINTAAQNRTKIRIANTSKVNVILTL